MTMTTAINKNAELKDICDREGVEIDSLDEVTLGGRPAYDMPGWAARILGEDAPDIYRPGLSREGLLADIKNDSRGHYGEDAYGTHHMRIETFKKTLSWDGTEWDEYETEKSVSLLELHPPEPECLDGGDHHWCTPHEILGGCEQSPGVSSEGGLVQTTEVCAKCGVYLHTIADLNSRADTISYSPADEESEKWAAVPKD